ncbi:YaiO family outer membrane beta-barrel protein [Lysobacter auxotrophicus]|uniref:YaiO family outer membrane beta-barrel protein n=1 Tax=Lysobacter auxotrophicus TaxID=2992573 RepID=A0ABM8DD87_9GAMM|nr:YaiO family outer membrane beta-barrel protein [Lysobacter auxotrophicus]BDU16563.1 YaiO family outer membrane beta-barrel protein [Lysobacter auxotrophicus]
MTLRTAVRLSMLVLAATAGAAHAQTVAQAQALVDVRDYAAATRVLEQRLQIAPDDADATFLLARTHAWNGEPARALPLYERLLAREPDNADFLLGYGQALTWAGRQAEAIDVLTRAQRLAPTYADIGTALAQARAAQAPAAAPDPLMPSPTDAPRPAVVQTVERRRTVSFSARHDWLDGAYDDWTGVRLDASRTQRGALGGYAALTGDRRFALDDAGIEAGLLVPMGETWLLQPEVGVVPDADFLPRYYADLRVQHTFTHGWIGSASLRTSDYPDTRVDRLAVSVERYWSAWRAAYTFNLTRLRDTHSPGHDVRLARAYGDGSEVGVQLVFGREAAIVESGVVASDVSGALLFGRHVFAQRWSWLWNVGVIDQGDLYTRRGIGIGLERRF